MVTDIVSQLKRDEGLRLVPYQDSLSYWTVGYGHKLLGNPEGVVWTPEKAESQLRTDIDIAIRDLHEAFSWVVCLGEPRTGVLVNMTFNMGISHLKGFTLTLQSIQAGHYEAASFQMLDSLWAKQVGPRATRLSIQMRTGLWQ